MPMIATAYCHIELDAKGRPCVAGTQTRVIDIAMDQIAYKWDAEQIQRQHPHLSLAQIHSALAYYYDHQAQLDAEIQERTRAADEFFKGKKNGPVVLRLWEARRQST
jgi:uncharacterized protein (DUF433 family)